MIFPTTYKSKSTRRHTEMRHARTKEQVRMMNRKNGAKFSSAHLIFGTFGGGLLCASYPPHMINHRSFCHWQRFRTAARETLVWERSNDARGLTHCGDDRDPTKKTSFANSNRWTRRRTPGLKTKKYPLKIFYFDFNNHLSICLFWFRINISNIDVIS